MARARGMLWGGDPTVASHAAGRPPDAHSEHAFPIAMTAPIEDTVGLCRRCTHVRIVRTPRSTFWRCALAEMDARFVRYPRLPVLSCGGFTQGAGPIDPDEESAPAEDPPGGSR